MAIRFVLFLAFLYLFPAAVQAETSDARQAIIHQLFPSATVIGEKQKDFPVWPVYQLQELLGYAYESTDLSRLQGFAGKPIRMMIGLDTQGRFTGVEILDHHEPVFLHGLGEEPLFEFVDQYEGRSLREQIIVRTSNSSRSGRNSEGDVVYFDGVSKATVSVLIVNDTVLSSALKVARQKLETFSQAAPTRAKTDFFEPMNWRNLIDRGYVGHKRLAASDVEQELGRPLTDYPEDLEPAAGEPFTEIFFAYMNSPMVGRNLLGDDGYQRFMDRLGDNDQVLMVASRGVFPHVDTDFTPGSAPDRIGLVQNDLAVEMRDLNWLDQQLRLQAGGLPDFDAAHLFRVGGNAGFNPGAEATLKLQIKLARNHLISDTATLNIPVAFNDDLFETVEIAASPESTRTPVWVGLWKERWAQITLLVAGLTVLTVVFVKQKTFSKHPKMLHRFRWIFLFFTLFFIGFYAQGQLSVVNIYTLLLTLWDGFSLDVFLLDPIIFILWTYTFITLFIWGRGLFCGWLCPFGALQEMSAWLGEKLRFRQIRVPERWHRRLILLKYPILLGLVGTAFYSLTLAEQLAEIEPFKTSITLFFWRYWPFVAYAVGLLVIGMFIHKFYCRYLCPLGAGLAVLGRFRLFSWLDRIESCGSPCQHCKNECGINAIRKDGRIDYDECIQCLECVVILRDESQCVDSIIRNKKEQKQRARILATDAAGT
ncbi:NosR/NirI family transcriptional regulator, nitrous oxide reductase regulator [Marinobacter daqiaonensis]|uniref:NosR/NirI family transcriptional regulator, nitrous oxide reductase regulator n=1 Tax=Marinobacter daqiaonensis TaxID=650891 RepID=A0A1I6HYM9_9GAMM|nr:NosR/NirI family protein [Marinobacter daqiaonensis]SFR59518.1 NosR/NirI family transcriptional regulator, nitrous oxide reductase regulator [Marinobacter daqiaonensis]